MKKMNNKGFSLVELIIVIAIMAILIVVLAPQYLKYVERSRNSTDMQNATTIKTAVETYAADPESTKVIPNSFEITISQTGGSINNDSTDQAVEQAITDAGLTLGDIKCSSKTRWSGYTLKGDIQSNGAIKWTYANTGGTATTAFSDAMNGTTTSSGGGN